MALYAALRYEILAEFVIKVSASPQRLSSTWHALAQLFMPRRTSVLQSKKTIRSRSSRNRPRVIGTPISALLSNVYLFDFDLLVKSEVDKVNGKYMRYCDDMLLIIPRHKKKYFEDFLNNEIAKYKLEINKDKTEVRDFSLTHGQLFSNKPLQYLGFVFDGKQVLLRSAALAWYSEKVKRGIRFAKSTMRKYNNLKQLNGQAPKALYKRKIYENYSHLGKRNFVSYGFRTARIFQSNAIKKQLKPLWGRLLKEIK